MMFTMSEDARINCTIRHEIHQYLFSSVYILVLLIGVPCNLYSLYHAALQLMQKNELGVYLMNLTVSDLLYLASLPLWLQFSSLRSMTAAWLISTIIWLKEIAVGVVFFHHKELSRDHKNQSVCFEHYPMQTWEYPINYYRFTIGFMFPLAILLISYLCVLRAVGRSAGTQPDQKTRIRQLVSSTILIFLICFSPYHVFLLIRTLLERDCNFITGIFNYYHLSLLLTSLNCVADPALYCFVSESARHGLYRAIIRPIARIFCCCCRRGNTSPTNPITDTYAVATNENNGQPTVTLLTHTSTLSNAKTHATGNNTLLTTETDEKTTIHFTVKNNRHSDECADSDGKPKCVIGMEDMSLKTEETQGQKLN
ncbi:hypothetical protein PAMP_006489 [Pampus punctatissimus]